MDGKPHYEVEELSRRLWSAKEAGEPKLANLIRSQEARAFVAMLEGFGREVKALPLRDLASGLNRGARDWAPEDAAAFLVTGTLALGASGALEGERGDDLFRSLMHGAFGRDADSIRLRGLTRVGLEDWPPFPDGDGPPFPPPREDCLADILNAATKAAGFVANSIGATATTSVDADVIASLEPADGSADDVVKIHGNFPTPQPGDRRVLFPRAGGGNLEATLTGVGWTSNLIEVFVPEPPGDGPVGFATGTPTGAGVTSLVEFGNTLASCLGPKGAGIGSKLNSTVPPSAMSPALQIPTLPGNVNVFHGGPVLVSVSAPGGSELDTGLSVTGLNLRAGDVVFLDTTPCSTTFVSATRLTFRPAALASGRKLLKIGRSYHRSNPISFDLRATLATTTVPGRVPPDTDVTLTGTGFGPGITATVDGLAASLRVVNTHSISVRVSRPARTPLATEKRREPVTIEVFDRSVSIGLVSATVATFRIASFGDSIVWGQGVPPAQRFTMLAADTITARRNGRIAVFALDHCANSGAFLDPFTATATPVGGIPRDPATNFRGECPMGVSIRGQVATWTVAPLMAEASEINLVILDGGINDVSVGVILDPTGDDTALVRTTTRVCGSGMLVLLADVLSAFPGVPVVVTGYYPIVSRQTDLNSLVPLLDALGLLAGVVTGLASGLLAGLGFPGFPIIGGDPLGSRLLRLWLQERLVARSQLFATTANLALAGAVASTRAAVPSSAIALAIPAFGPANSIFAPDTFLWGAAFPSGPEDPVAATRVITCGTSPINVMASIGHPNLRGARAYGDAIAAVLPGIGL